MISASPANDLATLFNHGALGLLPDAELLARFVDGRGGPRSESAFHAIVTRHGPMVLGVCRRILNDPHAAADAFQATFLVLVRKAPKVRVDDSLGRWLHGVSLRVAKRARSVAIAERSRTRALGEIDLPQDPPSSELLDLRAVIDEEIARLPSPQRSAVRLCYLEGLTQDQAAARLGCPVGTIGSRLHRAREGLRVRLTRRGLAPAGCVAATMAAATARADVPASLISRTVRFGSGPRLATATSAVVTRLADLTIRRFLMIKMAWTGLGLAAIVLLGAVGLSAQSPRNPSPRIEPAGKAVPAERRTVRGTVLDPDGRAVPGATVVAGVRDTGKPNHEVLNTDNDGRFSWPLPDGWVDAYIVAHKEGFAPATWMDGIRPGENGEDIEMSLRVSKTFSAVLVDVDDRPLAGAKVRVELCNATSEEPGRDGQRGIVWTTIGYVFHDVLSGSPLAPLFETTTDARGEFQLDGSAGNRLKLGVTTSNGWAMLARDVATGEGNKATNRAVAIPVAGIEGRVWTRMPGVKVGGLKVWLQGVNGGPEDQVGRPVLTDPDGDFTIRGLVAGSVNLFVAGDGDGDVWTFEAVADQPLASNKSAVTSIELIPGVEVTGSVVSSAGAPIQGADVAVYGPRWPRSGAATRHAKTNANGRYRHRLPPGETYFYVMNAADHFTTLADNGSSRTVEIPADVKTFEVPAIEVASDVVVLHGRVVDANDQPVPGATIVGVIRFDRHVLRYATPAGKADAKGELRLAGQNHIATIGQPAKLLVRLADDREFEVEVTPDRDGRVIVKLPE